MEQKYCLEKNKDNYGWSALYDIAKGKTLEAGVILCYLPPSNRRILFELDEDLDLFNDIAVEALPGSMIANDSNGDGWYRDDPIGKILLASCRFPTKKELDAYEKMVSV